MKCSPFSRGLKKGSKKHLHRHRGKFLKHLKRRFMEGYESSSSSSSSSSEDSYRNQTESDNGRQQRMERDHSMNHEIRHGHDMMHDHDNTHGRRHGMMHGKRHGHEMTHGRRHGMMYGMRHGHEMMHERGHGHEMMHGRRHGHEMMHERGHGHDMMHGMRRDHGMKHWHGKRRDHGWEHRMQHRHGMKHKMRHGHGRKHKMGHGPGMHHKLRREIENVCPDNRNEARPLEVNIENRQENSESDAYTFYEPKTSAQVMNENNRFQITLETSYYQPEEVSVKIADGKIDVSAMHESMENDLYEFHEMYRSFNIPNNVNPEVITARLDAEAKLIIEATCIEQGENLTTERDVPVIRVSE